MISPDILDKNNEQTNPLQIRTRNGYAVSFLFLFSHKFLHLGHEFDSYFLWVNSSLDLLEREVVAIIRPQKSDVVEFVSNLGDAAQVTVVSFSATDPLLSNARYSYFVCMAHSDALQMHSIVALVQAYGWRRVTVGLKQVSLLLL